MKTAESRGKYEQLLHNIRTLGRVAVAFSGGIDSTFLLHAACEALGENKVIALYGFSCLLPAHSVQATSQLFERHFSGIAQLRQIELHPLHWPEFAVNDDGRCYFCKKRIYSFFKMEMEQDGCCHLADGTNVDDLRVRRPGLRAIDELGVLTPLVAAGFHKDEIRDLARTIGLANHNLPSNSCLATRVTINTPVTAEIIRLIDDAEHFLHEKGFHGCRVRPGVERTVIEVRADSFERITCRDNRESILLYFQSIGLSRVVLDLHGRE